MRPAILALLCLALGAQACQSSYDPDGPIGVRNMWAANEIRQASLHQAILNQSTLYPYHFVHATAELNELGWRDMQVLAEHYLAHGGALSVRRAGADDQLYAARLESVQAALTTAGVEPGRVRLSDSPPGGAGTTSERVLEVLENARKQLQTEDVSTSSQSGSASTANTSSSASAGSN